MSEAVPAISGTNRRPMPSGRRFVPGQSGNPNGRPKAPAHVRDMARALSPEAIETAANCMRDEGASWSARMQAVQTILDRAWGKAVQPVDLTDNRPLASLPAEMLIAAIQALVVVQPAPAEPPAIEEG